MGLTPPISIYVDGVKTPASANTQSLVVVDGDGYEHDHASVTIAIGGREIRIPELGSTISFGVMVDGEAVGLGYQMRIHAAHGSTREGIVRIDAAPVSPLSTLRQPRNAGWAGADIGTIAGVMAERAGLIPAVDRDIGAIRNTAVQLGESDQAFLARIAARAGGRMIVRSGRLVVVPTDAPLSASGDDLPATALDVRELGAWISWSRRERNVIQKVRSAYFAPDGITKLYVDVGSGTPVKWQRLPLASKEAAERRARRALGDATAGVDHITIESESRLLPSVRAQFPLAVAGLPPGLPTRLIAHEVRHEIGEGRAASTTITARPQ